MVCIYCGQETNVVNSRHLVRRNQVWRRRKCRQCFATFTTIENSDLSKSLRVENEHHEFSDFNRDRLLLSIYRSVDHLTESIHVATELTDEAITQLTKNKPLSPIVTTVEIIKITSVILKRFNAAASVKYLSYHQSLRLPSDINKSLR